MFFFFPFFPGGGGFFLFFLIVFLLRLLLILLSSTGSKNRRSGRSSYTYYYSFNQNRDDDFRHSENADSGSSQFIDPYEVLGLTSSATEIEIKKAYRKLIRENHPDVISAKPDVSEAEKLAATERFRKVQEAYEQICKLRNIR